MKRNKLAIIILAVLLCGCSQNNTATTVPSVETTAETSVTATASETTEATAETTTETTATAMEKTSASAAETATSAITTVTEEMTTPAESAPAATEAETTTAESSATTTEVTTTAVTEITTTVTTTPEATAEKTKKTKKTTTTAETTVPETTTTSESTTAPETTETVTTTEPVKGDIYIDGEAYKLTFTDEFDGHELDLSKWEYCPEWKRQDLECYWDNDCVSFEDGKLVLTAEDAGDAYYMGAIRSKGRFEQAYGYFEVRCTLNSIPGYWTAFWLMGETVAKENDSGVDGTEIDIMESAYYNRGVQHTLNWDGYGENHKASGYVAEKTGLYDGSYHTFSLLWTEDEYIFYIDGQESWRTSAEEAGGVCTVPLYLKFTAETGSWTAAELTGEGFPDNVYVDYIRVYAKA